MNAALQTSVDSITVQSQVLPPITTPPIPKQDIRLRLDALTGIRALAALWVVMFHMNMGRIHFGFLNPLMEKGYLGVDLFFILSGFIISFVHLKDFKSLRPKPYVQFLLVRLARLMPVHLVIMGLFGVFYLLLLVIRGYKPEDAIHFTPIYFLYGLLNIHAWGFARHLSWNYLSWSISAEWFAYILFPFLALILSKVQSRRLSLVGICISFAALALIETLCGHHTLQEALSLPLIRVVTEFTAGIFLYQVFQHSHQSHQTNSRWDWITGLTGVCLITLIYLKISDFWLVPGLAMLLYGLANAKGLVKTIFSSRLAMHGGEISYSLYLVGAFITTLLEQVIKMGHLIPLILHYPALYLFIHLGLLILSAQLLYAWVEMPARTALRRQINGWFQADGANRKTDKPTNKSPKEIPTPKQHFWKKSQASSTLPSAHVRSTLQRRFQQTYPNKQRVHPSL